MFFYQALITLAVMLLLGFLVFVLRIKNKGLLAAAVLLLSVAGAAGVLGVQSYFGSHVYNQKVNIALVRRLSFSSEKKKSLDTVFSDYTRTDTEGLLNYHKIYQEKSGNITSNVTVNVSVFPSKQEADHLFSISQKFYDNKNFAPIDPTQSLRTPGLDQRYLVTFIKTQYGNYTDLFYRPSRMSSFSYVIIQDGNIIMMLSERAHKPVCTKNAVLADLAGRLGT